MNWDEIDKKYPKSYKKVVDWFEAKYDLNLDYPTDIRYLYDFFDEQGIYIGIDSTSGKAFFCWIDTEPEDATIYLGGDTKYWDNRVEAEMIAFEKAFEILENKGAR